MLVLVELLQLRLQDAPPALRAVILEALLDPLPGLVEPEALLELLGHLVLELVGVEHLSDDLIDPTLDLLAVHLLSPFGESLLGRYHLAAHPVLLQLALDVLNAARIGQDGVQLEAVAFYAPAVCFSLVEVLLRRIRKPRAQLPRDVFSCG